MKGVEQVAADIVAQLAAAKDDSERTAIVARVCREIYAAGRDDERRALAFSRGAS